MPLILEKQVNPSSFIAVWKISESEGVLKDMLPPLKEADKNFLERISNENRRLEWLASRILIYQKTGLYPSTFYNNWGQPVLTECKEHISISHTYGYAAIASSSDCFPGIDIEYPSDRIEKVANRFLTQTEKTYISEVKKDKQLGLIWCAKEAIYKKAGQPGLIFNKQIEIEEFIPEQTGYLNAILSIQNEAIKVRTEYMIEKDYYLAWVF